MRQHHAFGKARGARGVLHIDHLIEVLRRQMRIEAIVADACRTYQQRVVTNHAAGVLVADVDDAAQVGQLHRMQSVILRAAQFRDNLINRRHVIDITKAVNRDQRAGFGLFEQIFQLGGAQRSIDGDEHRADLGKRELQHYPFGNVGRPERHAVAALDA